MIAPTIETSRLLLRPQREEDFARHSAMLADPEDPEAFDPAFTP